MPHEKHKLALKVNKVPVFNWLSSEFVTQMKTIMDVLTVRLKLRGLTSKSSNTEAHRFIVLSGFKISCLGMEVRITWHVLRIT